MSAEVLVAYCTRSGSTAEVAQAISKSMNKAGILAHVKPMAEVESIGDVKAVVLGTALYIGHFPKEFHRFVTRFQAELTKMRPWIFVLGPTENKPEHFSSAGTQAHRDIARYPWLRPADLQVLGGRFDPEHLILPFPMSLIMKIPANPMRKMPASDIRDWERIDEWARKIADQLTATV